MTKQDAYDQLSRRGREVATLNGIAAVLGWDQQTYMPKGGAATRGEQMAWLATATHAKATDPAIGDWLAAAEGLNADADSVEAANLREWKHGYERAKKIPAKLVEEMAIVTTAAQQAWDEAKSKSDFPTFAPHLGKVVALKREEADCVKASNQSRYDALLDEYEPGMTSGELVTLFAELKKRLVPLIAAIGESPRRPNASIFDRDYPLDRQRLFGESVASAIGLDFHTSRLDVTSHPFCTTFGPGDTRITTRFKTNNLESLFGILHETGHALYELGLPTDRFGEPCGSYCSLGVHESQSRLWENLVGRSRPFWKYFFPRLKQSFPMTLADVNIDDFYFAVNQVRPSLIRVDADEVTYNLHVGLRFEMELALINDDFPVKELPGAWNAAMKANLGVTVPDDRHGCLQDIHWSFGGIGYFPTYTIGNLLAAQWMVQARKEIPGLDDEFGRGRFESLLLWLRTKIHSHGRRFRTNDLCRRVTGSALSVEPFLTEISGKVGKLYGLS